jgi:hypothetical protein
VDEGSSRSLDDWVGVLELLAGSSAFGIASLYADLGDKDQAFRWLNTAYQERDEGLVSLRTYFLLDPLRSDARFAELVRKVGLPQ